MLTLAEYESLWTSSIPSGFQENLPVRGDNYLAYCKREEMFEDYLDIFRGFSSRSHTIRNSPSTLNTPHPFFNKDGALVFNPQLNTKPTIKYILVGEAPPNGGINYFYEPSAITGQGYLIEIFNAEYNGVGPSFSLTSPLSVMDKIKALIDLAQRGVLLVDLFPFATDFKKTGVDRGRLTLDGVTSSFWCNNTNPYNFIDRILNLYSKNKNIFAEDLDVTIGFVAPPTISHFISGNINAGVFPIPAGATLRLGHNSIAAATTRNSFFYKWPYTAILNGFIANPGTLKFAPIYQCCGYSPAMTIPHRLFITNAMR